MEDEFFELIYIMVGIHTENMPHEIAGGLGLLQGSWIAALSLLAFTYC